MSRSISAAWLLSQVSSGSSLALIFETCAELEKLLIWIFKKSWSELYCSNIYTVFRSYEHAWMASSKPITVKVSSINLLDISNIWCSTIVLVLGLKTMSLPVKFLLHMCNSQVSCCSYQSSAFKLTLAMSSRIYVFACFLLYACTWLMLNWMV